jgi:hypothetical protein
VIRFDRFFFLELPDLLITHFGIKYWYEMFMLIEKGAVPTVGS